MTENDQPRERFTLVLEALPSEVPAARRLAQALKHLLRAHRLKCIHAVEVKPQPPQEDAGHEQR